MMNHSHYAEILQSPLDDKPRERVARALDSSDPARAEFVRAGVQRAQLEAIAIAKGLNAPAKAAELGRRSRDLLKEHGDRWASEDELPVRGTWVRGFLEVIGVSPLSDLRAVELAIERCPVLHLEVVCAPTYSWFVTLQGSFSRLVSLDLADVSDADVSQLLAGTSLMSLRRLTLRNAGAGLSESAMHEICAARLSGLEELRVFATAIRNPCEEVLSLGDHGQDTDARRSEFGEELERRYGWRKFLHAASRISERPCSFGALDVLPPLPDDLVVRTRRWDDPDVGAVR